MGCSVSKKNNPEASFFRIPAILRNEEHSISKKRTELWISRINRKNITTTTTLRVCNKHFKKGRPSKLFESSDPDWAPNQYLGYSLLKEDGGKSSLERYERRLKRIERKSSTAAATTPKTRRNLIAEVDPAVDDDPPPVENDKRDNNTEIEAGDEIHIDEGMNTKNDDINEEDTDVKMMSENAELKKTIAELNIQNENLQKQLQNFKFDESKFKSKNESVVYYTGLPHYDSLMALYTLTKDFIRPGKILSSFEKLMLCLMRLRLGSGLIDLADRFRISKSTASTTFHEVLEVLFVRTKPLVYWPERPELIMSMPMSFRVKFGTKITTIIDCFELFIERPGNLTARATTWSHYKSHNTVKYLIGITPQGTVSFISKGWGGRTSDQHITENSGFLKYLMYGDTVMADRGFNIAETLGAYGSRLEIPAFTKGQTQLRPEEVECTRTIANVRIHVERVIGNLRKKYQILNQTIPIDFLCSREEQIPTIDKLVCVSCALLNICPSVVPME